MIDPESIGLSVSEISLPADNPRDRWIKMIDAKCADLVKVCHALQETQRELSSLSASSIDKGKLVSAAANFGKYEERFYTLKETINEMVRRANQDEHLDICVSYTADGVPIRVNKNRKIPAWGI